MSGHTAGTVSPYQNPARRALGVGALVRPGARSALVALWAVLDAAGDPPPCAHDPEQWFTDKPSEAGPAILGCGTCPAVTECRDFALANRERHGTWGGVYLGPRRDVALPARGAHLSIDFQEAAS